MTGKLHNKEGYFVCYHSSRNEQFALLWGIGLVVFTALGLLVANHFGKYWGFGATVSGLCTLILLTNKTEVDISTLKYRDGFSFLGISFSRWKPLPPLNYISLSPMLDMYLKRNPTDDLYNTYPKLQVRLYDQSKNYLLVFEGEDRNEAELAAHFLAEKLELKILDGTKRPFKWIDE